MLDSEVEEAAGQEDVAKVGEGAMDLAISEVVAVAAEAATDLA